ncbi:hypothetical protein J21TS7_23070 [Paenibacillus cineris]|uniref:Uncharacterized protein n=1 Tax=Paenibacillus cineris TaxID=237530 RepID=A0ABQ4LBP1_9BACL|nr:hypothetical protein J21TS7_23070 [Paenibacillus cineris]
MVGRSVMGIYYTGYGGGVMAMGRRRRLDIARIHADAVGHSEIVDSSYCLG